MANFILGGLKQWDPLSPSSFFLIICADGLLALTMRSLEMGDIHGIQIAMGASVISYLLFAYDNIFLGRACELETRRWKETLDRYRRVLG